MDPQFSEEYLMLMADLGVSEDKLEAIRAQMAQAQQIRGQAAPGMRNMGNTTMAANPLEHLTSGIQKFRANRELGRPGQGEEGQEGYRAPSGLYGKQADTQSAIRDARMQTMMEMMRMQGRGGGGGQQRPGMTGPQGSI